MQCPEDPGLGASLPVFLGLDVTLRPVPKAASQRAFWEEGHLVLPCRGDPNVRGSARGSRGPESPGSGWEACQDVAEVGARALQSRKDVDEEQGMGDLLQGRGGHVGLHLEEGPRGVRTPRVVTAVNTVSVLRDSVLSVS